MIKETTFAVILIIIFLFLYTFEYVSTSKEISTEIKNINTQRGPENPYLVQDTIYDNKK